MLRQELINKIESIKVGDNFTIESSSFDFECSCIGIHSETVIIFGGNGIHFSIWTPEYDTFEEIADGMIEHMGGYHSELTERITINECKLVA